GAGYALEDLGSRNGTFVNGAPLEGKRVLADGDHIRFGDRPYRFALEAPARKAAESPADRLTRVLEALCKLSTDLGSLSSEAEVTTLAADTLRDLLRSDRVAIAFCAGAALDIAHVSLR